MQHKVYDFRHREVGYWDDQENPKIYHTQRNFNFNQIFKSSHFNNEVGIDVGIVKNILLPNNITHLDYFITGIEKISFHVYIDLKRFLKLGREVNFQGRQIIVPLGYFNRHNPKEDLMYLTSVTKI